MGQHRQSAETPARPVARQVPAQAAIPTQHRVRQEPVELPSLPVRARLAVSAGQATVRACQVLGRGWGARAGSRVALRVDPRLARRLAAGRTITLVSGTNGKSTATRMIAEALRSRGPVAFTRTTAGGEQGVVAALAREKGAGRAVLEVDELALPEIARATRAAVIVLLNLSREYRPGRGLAAVLARWRDLFDTLDWPCTVLANLDDPLVAWAAANAPRLVGVAGGLLWPQDALLCPDCGVRLRWSGPRWWCDICGAARPEPAWQLSDEHMIIGPEVTTPLRLEIPGRAAPADALFAVAAAHTVGTPVRDAGRAVSRVSEVDGRYAAYPFEAHRVRLLLADNPAAWREVIEVAGHADVPVIFAMEPDGVADTAPLWDAPGELLHGVPVTVAGTRRYDLAAWLEACGVEVAGVADDALAVVAELPPGEVLVAANYPAFTALRTRLRGRLPGRRDPGRLDPGPLDPGPLDPGPLSAGLLDPGSRSRGSRCRRSRCRRSRCRKSRMNSLGLIVVTVHPLFTGAQGDEGNARVLRHRAVARGIDTTLLTVHGDDRLPAADIYLLGGVDQYGQVELAERLRGEGGLRRAVGRGAVAFGVGAGLQVLGEWFTTPDGQRHPGAELLDVRCSVEPDADAVTGPVVTLPGGALGLPAMSGYESHTAHAELGPDATALAQLEIGVGNGDGTDGAVTGRVVGTWLHGPVLARNPDLADALLGWAVDAPLPALAPGFAAAVRAQRLAEDRAQAR